jgi:hypothetical protein
MTATILGSCQRSAEQGQAVRDGPPLAFVEANSVGLALAGAKDAANGAGIKADLVNRTDEPITITRVEPIADPGVRVTYLGYSTCRRGCPGAEPWTEDTPDLDTKELVDRTIDGTVPLTMRPSPHRLSLLFRVQVEPDGLDAFRRGCRHLRAIRARLRTGRTLTVTMLDGHWVAAVQQEEPRPAGYVACDVRAEPGKG